MPSSSSAVRSGAALALVLAVAAFVRHEEPVPRAPVRPAVVLLVAITGDYRYHLVDEHCTKRCDTLVRVMQPAVRAALAAQYPFIDWNPPTDGAPDTIIARWENESEFYRATQVEFVLRQGGRVVDSVQVPFEHDTVISRRTERDWSVEALRREWQARLPGTVRGSDLLPRIFGRVPLNAEVDFARPGDVLVKAHKDTLRAGVPHPVFEVSVMLDSDRLDIEDVGTALLDECVLAGGSRGYTCPLDTLTAGNRTFGPAEVAELRRLDEVKWRATRLRSFKPGAPSIQLRGLEP